MSSNTDRVDLDKNNFWSTDLSQVESVFLRNNQKITDLPTALHGNVPPQGSVLLENIVNIDSVIGKPSFFKRWVSSIL